MSLPEEETRLGDGSSSSSGSGSGSGSAGVMTVHGGTSSSSAASSSSSSSNPREHLRNTWLSLGRFLQSHHLRFLLRRRELERCVAEMCHEEVGRKIAS